LKNGGGAEGGREEENDCRRSLGTKKKGMGRCVRIFDSVMSSWKEGDAKLPRHTDSRQKCEPVPLARGQLESEDRGCGQVDEGITTVLGKRKKKVGSVLILSKGGNRNRTRSFRGERPI